MSNVKLFDVQHSNDDYQNDLNVKCQCRTSNCLMFGIQMSKVKLFDVQHSNVNVK